MYMYVSRYNFKIMKTFLLLIATIIAMAQAVSFFELVNQEWTTFKVIKSIVSMDKKRLMIGQFCNIKNFMSLTKSIASCLWTSYVVPCGSLIMCR